MRITTWNCSRGGPHKKIAAAAELRPDILVMQECAQLDLPADRYYWHGEYVKQGVSVQTFGDYRLTPLPQRPDVPPFVLPIQIEGPQQMLLFAVWTKATRGQQYIRGLNTAIEIYRDLFANQPTVVIGDYNSNAIWDKDHPKERNHSALVGRLEALGLVSTYHAHYGEAHGAETRPTYFQYRRATDPFHIDYCLAPKAWVPRLRSVEVGSHGDWFDLSDHVPLTVEFADGWAGA